MTKLNLPRYFVARSDSQPAVARAENFIPLYALDNFFAGGRHLQEQEWVVSVDAAGILRATNGDQINQLSSDIQSQIAFSEVATEGKIRLVETVEFYLFNIQLLEQAAGAPGLNDPIYLYGTLHGPFPQSSGQDAYAIEGQLTVTRSDLLDALVQGAKYRFKTSGGGADIGSTANLFHMVLPGDRDEETLRGAGFIFAYPLLPPDMMLYGASNEVLISQYLFDILTGIRDDLEEENIKVPLRRMRLPVPNRLSLEQELEAQGYIIKGDTAVRKPNTKGGLNGFVHSVFGSSKDELTLPAEGSIEEFLRIADQVIHSLPGWPPERAKIMRGKIQPASREVRMRAKGTAALKPREIKTPNYTEPPRPNVNHPSTTGGARAGQYPNPAGWMQDFINQHQNTNNANSVSKKAEDDGGKWTKLTHSQSGPGSTTFNTFSYSSNTSYSNAAKHVDPSWMDDFANGDTPIKRDADHNERKNLNNQDKLSNPEKLQSQNRKTENKQEADKPQRQPDWRKDFD